MGVNLQAAKSWLPRFWPAYTLHGGPPHVEEEVMAASQTLLPGDPVTKSTGVISKATATSGAIYGVCLDKQTTTAANEAYKVRVAVADRSNVFIGRCEAASSVLVELAECDITTAANSKWILNSDATVEGVCLAVKHVPGDDTADTLDGGRVYFVWKRSEWDALVASK